MADGVTEGPIVGVGGGVADNLASNDSEKSISNCCLIPQLACSSRYYDRKVDLCLF